MEQDGIDDARRILGVGIEGGKIIPFAALALAADSGHDKSARRRPVVLAGGAEHLARDAAVAGSVDGDDLAAEIHFDIIGHFVREGGQRADHHHQGQKENEQFLQLHTAEPLRIYVLIISHFSIELQLFSAVESHAFCKAFARGSRRDASCGRLPQVKNIKRLSNLPKKSGILQMLNVRRVFLLDFFSMKRLYCEHGLFKSYGWT